MDKPGFITPPPDLIPPPHDTGTQTRKDVTRGRELPVFIPGGPVSPAERPVPDTATGMPESVTAPPPDARSRLAEACWSITLPEGAVVEVDGPVLVGRNPVRFGGWGTARLVSVVDPQTSVSKTHAAFDVANGVLSVIDLHSTNGVTVESAGAERLLEPGRAATISEGDVVRLGRFAVEVGRR